MHTRIRTHVHTHVHTYNTHTFTHTPQVTVFSRADDDDFLLLASDGLWDVMSNQVLCAAMRFSRRDVMPQHTYPHMRYTRRGVMLQHTHGMLRRVAVRYTLSHVAVHGTLRHVAVRYMLSHVAVHGM